MATQLQKVYPKWDRMYCESRLNALYTTIERLPDKENWLLEEFNQQLKRWWGDQCSKYANDPTGMTACEEAYNNMYEVWGEFDYRRKPQPELDLFSCLDGDQP